MILKKIIKKLLGLCLWPVRCCYRRRNGVTSIEPRKEIPNDILLGLARDMMREGHTATIAVKGWSMRPFLEHQRDKVTLRLPDELKEGDAVLAEIAPGHYVLHRIIDIKGDNITLMGDGNLVGTERCRRQDVAGVVTHYIRPGRTIEATDKTLRRRIRVWRRLLPVRRYLLLIYSSIV